MKFLAQQRESLYADIAALWDNGVPTAEMAQILGTTVNSLSTKMARMKQRGWVLTPRRSGWAGHSVVPGQRPSPDSELTKRQVRMRLAHALLKGQIQKPVHCTGCGAHRFIEAHHHDYSKPLDVEWLCCRCHRERHGAIYA